MTSTITDFTQYTDLRRAAGQNDPGALREVAEQFEALFLQTMLKSMRDASIEDPLFGDSDQMETYQGMMDQQLAVEMASGKGVGLADMLVRQLGGVEANNLDGPRDSFPIPRSKPPHQTEQAWSDPLEFARDIWPHAERTAKQLNVAPEAIVAQAALETGWGQHVIPGNSGATSFNLFGIKSGSEWQGDQVVRKTLEFEGGVPRPQNAHFRAYDGVAMAFSDYTSLITDNPRYSDVRDHGHDVAGFARALQASGYATDPDYAEKINQVSESPTMRRAMSELRAGN